MSAQLGVGVPVFVGWLPDHMIAGGPPDVARCQHGVITDGPVFPGRAIPWDPNWLINLTGQNVWRVKLDNGYNATATERILFPIDDGDGSFETEREREVTA